jgi:hypothetical protein
VGCYGYPPFLFVPQLEKFRALRLHPDKGGDPELFKEVTHAYVSYYEKFYLLLTFVYVGMKSFLTPKSEAFTMREARQV